MCVEYRTEKQPEDGGSMVALLNINKIGKEIISQKKRGITFITREILHRYGFRLEALMKIQT